ncbi:MAG: complex subunit conserved region [Hyphomicrobiales bacterium]|nr:complex subunit conserved region [Hyphomicrobiales bacterium]
MTARIYRPAKSATQSGTARSKTWLLEYMPREARQIEPLMGWTSSGDMNSQLKLWFATQDEAVAYAQREGIAYRVEEPKPATRRVMSYSDNFKPSRIDQWTH